jgi:transcription-repair coupling factor (superfamily II helicase)
LGRDQSGHIASIGYDLYVQMVSEAVSELKGEPRPQPIDLSVDLPDAAHLPPGYVEAEDVRLEAYRRLSSVRTLDEVADVRAEWEDRFGPLPAPATALLEVALLRVECLRLGVTDLAVSVPRFAGDGVGPRGGPGGRAVAKLTPITLPASAEVRLRRLVPGGNYQPEARRLTCPIAPDPVTGGYAPALVALLRELVPTD